MRLLAASLFLLLQPSSPSSASVWPQSGGGASRARLSGASGPTGAYNYTCWCMYIKSDDSTASFGPASSSDEAVYVRVGLTPGGGPLSDSLLALARADPPSVGVAATPHSGRPMPRGGAFRLLWNRSSPADVVGVPRAAPALHAATGTLFYAEESRGVVYALDAATGAERWAASGLAAAAVSPVLSDDGTLLTCASSRDVFALNTTTGARLWSSSVYNDALRFAVSGLVLAARAGTRGEDLIIVSGVACALAAFDAASGRGVWNSSDLCAASLAARSGGGGGSGAPAAEDEMRTGAVVGSGASAGLVFVALTSDAIAAVNASTGATAWVFAGTPSPQSAARTPALARGGARLYTSVDTDARGGVVVIAIDAVSGREAWRAAACQYALNEQADYSLAVGNDGVVYGYCADEEGSVNIMVFGVDGSTGARVFYAYLGGTFFSPGTVVDGPVIGPNQTIIATSNAGYVCAIGCDATGAAPLPISASPSAPAPAPASASAGGSFPMPLILSAVGASVALAAAGLGLSAWSRRRNGSSSDGSDGDGVSSNTPISGGDSIGGGITGAVGGYGATGQTSGLGATIRRGNTGLPRPTETYSALEEVSPILVHELPGEPSEDPAVEEERDTGGTDVGLGARKLVFDIRQQSDWSPPEAQKLLL